MLLMSDKPIDLVLPAEVLDCIVEFIALADARGLLLASRTFNAVVRYSWPVWKNMVVANCAYSVNLSFREAQHRQKRGEVVHIDWLTLYANHRGHLCAHITPWPHCNRMEGPKKAGVSLARAFTSVARWAFESSHHRHTRQFLTVLSSMPLRAQCLITGLDGAGKSLLCDHARSGEEELLLPTNIGFQVERFFCKHVECLWWDVGTSARVRPLYRHYYQVIKAQFFVVDSKDVARIPAAVHECRLQQSHPSLSRAPLLVFANKQDVPRAMSSGEVTNAFHKGEALNAAPMWCSALCGHNRGGRA